MKKLIFLFLVLIQAFSFSKTIKFLVVNSVTGAEIKPDSIVFQYCNNYNRFRVTSDSLILTEVETPTNNFTNSDADFKLKANLFSNNLILDIDNISADKVSIELYGYLGTSLYSQDISLFSGMNHKEIPLDFTNEKLLFLRVKSNNSIANVKLNRTAESCVSEIRSISKPVDEILGGFPIDTAFNYNIYVYKKGYKDYTLLNVSFLNINSFTVKLIEFTKSELIIYASIIISGIQIERTYIAKSTSPQDTIEINSLDTTDFKFNTTIKKGLNSGLYGTCYVGNLGVGLNCVSIFSFNANSSSGYNEYSSDIKSCFNFTDSTLSFYSFYDCHDSHTAFNSYFFNSKSRLNINSSLKYKISNNKYVIHLDKNDILKLINTKHLSVSNTESHRSYGGQYGSSYSDNQCTQISDVADDAYIEISFWE